MLVVAEVESAPALIAAFRAERPDVVLLDLCFRREQTADAVHTLRGEFPEARFLIFTGFQGQDEVLLALKDRMQGYLVKTATPAEIVEAIRTVCRGGKWLSPALSLKLGNAVAEPTLTEREQEVLIAVASGNSESGSGNSAVYLRGNGEVPHQ